MQIRKLTASILRVPLRRAFRHASAVRDHSENIVVQTELANGTTGWGEGVPREYVTGETPQGALDQLVATNVGEQLSGDVVDWQGVFWLCDRFAPAEVVDDRRGCHGNALRAAVELSVLDAYGKLFEEPLSAAIEHFAPAAEILNHRHEVRYSTTIDTESGRKLWRSALKMRVYGFRQCKVKVGADNSADTQRVAMIRKWIGPRVDLRIDANEAWRPENMVSNIQQLAESGISCVEQPLPHADLAALEELRAQIETPVMLDESLTSLSDAQEAIRLDACDLFNIRISKCGGLLNSLRMATFAAEHGIAYQLGCHPGETGILSAAGRHFASTVQDIRYLEGSYDRHLLAKTLTRPDMTFSYGGRAPALKSPGLGATLDEQAAAENLSGKLEFTIDQ